MGSTDYLEQYFAINIVFEPLVGELFRSGFLMQVAAANNDFITPSVISAAEADYERNLANTIDLVYLLANDEQHAAAQPRRCSRAGSTKHGALADKAAARPAADLVAAALQAGLASRRSAPSPRSGSARSSANSA